EPGGKALMMLSAAKAASPEEAANAFLQQNGLQPVDSKETTVNGLSAIAVIADTKAQEGQQQQQALRTVSYFIKYGDMIYLIMGVSAASDFEKFFDTFTGSQESFAELTDTEKINRKPERITIKS